MGSKSKDEDGVREDRDLRDGPLEISFGGEISREGEKS